MMVLLDDSQTADVGSIEFWIWYWWAISILELLIFKKMELELINLELNFATKKNPYSKQASIENRLASNEVMDDFKTATKLDPTGSGARIMSLVVSTICWLPRWCDCRQQLQQSIWNSIALFGIDKFDDEMKLSGIGIDKMVLTPCLPDSMAGRKTATCSELRWYKHNVTILNPTKSGRRCSDLAILETLPTCPHTQTNYSLY